MTQTTEKSRLYLHNDRDKKKREVNNTLDYQIRFIKPSLLLSLNSTDRRHSPISTSGEDEPHFWIRNFNNNFFRGRYEPVSTMEVRVVPEIPSVSRNIITLQTHPNATVDSLISAVCVEHKLHHEPHLGLYNASGRLLWHKSSLRSQSIHSSDTLYLRMKREDDELLYYTNWKLLSAICLLLGILGFIIVLALFVFTGGTIPFVYGIVIDAGSSHSGAFLYHWEGDKYQGTGRVLQVAAVEDDDLGISDLGPRKAKRNIALLLENITELLPPHRISTTPVYLASTAGMRLLNITNPNKAEATFVAVECAMRSSGLQFEYAGILPGKDEGIFAWLTTNYLFDNIPAVSEFKLPENLGALDLGGASTQIAFQVNDSLALHPEVTRMRLYGRDRYVFARSYLCFGLNEVIRRYYSRLTLKNNFAAEILSPCHPNGWKKHLDYKYLFAESPCTKTPFLPTDIWNNLNKSITFTGGGNYQKCMDDIKHIASSDKCSSDGYDMCMNELDISIPKTKFAAFSAFYHNTAYLNYTRGNFSDLKRSVGEYCPKMWIDIKQSTKLKAKYLENRCAASVYAITIIEHVYKFSEEQFLDMTFLLDANGFSFGWSLGYMINATNVIPSEGPTPPVISPELFGILIVVSIVLVLFGVVFGLLARRRCRNKADSQYEMATAKAPIQTQAPPNNDAETVDTKGPTTTRTATHGTSHPTNACTTKTDGV